MQNFDIILFVFTILIALLAIADKTKVPTPVLLVIAGLIIGFIPSIPSLVLSPDVVFLLFLPPILYDAASHTSWHDFKAEIRPISALAIALVFFTTMAVAIVCYYWIPGFSWPLAFVLGSIVSPPDAVAATNMTKGLGLNKRIITILEGESLVNDASALIAYRFSLIALTTGSFVFWQAGVNFLLAATGGILTGALIGFIFITIHKRIHNNSIISTSLTLLAPFISYLTAEHLHTSGVLAVVCTGLLISWRAPEIFTYQTRIRNRAVWDTCIFLLNGFIFMLIGLQLPLIFADLDEYGLTELLAYGLLVSGVTIAVRIMWVFSVAYSPFARNSTMQNELDFDRKHTWKNVLIVAWTGTRGVVSLATALALPYTLGQGSPFPQRSLLLFLAFVVIFMTLIVQGLSLPLLTRLLGITPQNENANEEWELRLLLALSVPDFIDHEFPEVLTEPIKTQIKKRYIELAELLSRKLEDTTTGRVAQSGIASAISPYLSAQLEINRFQRQLLIKFHKQGTFTTTIIRQLEQELDYEELQLSRKIK